MATAIAPGTFASRASTTVDNPALLNVLILDHDGFVREAAASLASSKRFGWSIPKASMLFFLT
jgi:hypothetical protein